MAKSFQKIADGDAEHTVIGTPRFEANQVGVAQLNFGRIFDQKNALVSSPNPIPFPSDLLLSQRPPPAFSLDRLGTGAEEKSYVFPQGRESLCASKWGFCPFRLVYGHADRCAVWASAPCGWSSVKGGQSLRLGKYDPFLPLHGIMRSSCHSHTVHNAFQGFCFFSRQAKIRGPRVPQDAQGSEFRPR